MNVTVVREHDPKRSVKGGQFKGGYDLLVGDHQIHALISGKIAHVYPDRTRCQIDRVLVGLSQFTINEEIIVKGDRHLTGFRIFHAHVAVLEGIGKGDRRHVPEGLLLGMGSLVHLSSTRPERLKGLLGL